MCCDAEKKFSNLFIIFCLTILCWLLLGTSGVFGKRGGICLERNFLKILCFSPLNFLGVLSRLKCLNSKRNYFYDEY